MWEIRRGDLGRLIGALRARGVTDGLRLARDRWLWRFDRAYDRQEGVATEGKLRLEEMSNFPANAGGEWYLPARVLVLRRIFDRMGVAARDFVFIDIGAGKGRAALLAAEHPFRRIIGVEHTPELHACFEANAVRLTKRRARIPPIQPVLGDATEFDLPEENCVLFFFNPLKPEALTKLVARIAGSYRAKPRRIVILFLNPARRNRVREIIAQAGVFRIRTLRDPWFAAISRFPLLICETDR